MKRIAFGLAALVLSAVASQASIIYDNPIFAGASGNEATRWAQASTFSLGSDMTITGGSVAVAGFGNIGNWDGTVEYWIFDNNGGTPGAVATSGTASVSGTTDTGVSWAGGGNIQRINFNFASTFDAVGGTDYWFGVHLSADYDRDNIYWVQSTTRNSTAESHNGTFDNWSVYNPARAFSLEGHEIAPVPLPAGGMMLVTAFGAMAFYRRRKS